MKTWNLFPLHCHSWFPPKNGAQQNLAQKRFERFFWCNGSISFTELSLFVEGKVSSKEPDVSRSLVTHSIPILYFRASYEKSLISTSHSWWYILSLDFHSNETLTFIPQLIHHPQGPGHILQPSTMPSKHATKHVNPWRTRPSDWTMASLDGRARRAIFRLFCRNWATKAMFENQLFRGTTWNVFSIWWRQELNKTSENWYLYTYLDVFKRVKKFTCHHPKAKHLSIKRVIHIHSFQANL